MSIPTSVEAIVVIAVITWGGLLHALMLYGTPVLLRWCADGALV